MPGFTATTTTFAERDEGRQNNFDALRLFFATLVIFSHSFPLTGGHARPDPLHALTQGQTNFGGLAVASFFVLSGYLITKSWLGSRGLADYTRRRLLRILPAYIVVCIVMLAAVVPVAAAGGRPVEWLPLIRQMATIVSPTSDSLFAGNPYPGALNGSLWTIRYELWCYFLVAALGVVGIVRWRGAVLGLFLFTLIWSAVQARWGDLLPQWSVRLFGDSRNWPVFLTFFLAGSAFFLYRDRVPYSPRLFAAATLVLVVTAAFLHPQGLLALLLPTLYTYVLLYVGFNPAIKLQNVGRRGDFSYGTYLYAFPVQQLLVQRFGPALNPYTLFLLATAVTLVFAMLSWFLVEKPALRRKSGTTRPAAQLATTRQW